MKAEYSLKIEYCARRDRRGNATWLPIEAAPPVPDSLSDDARLTWVVAGVTVMDSHVRYAEGHLLAIVEGATAGLEHRDFCEENIGDARTTLMFRRHSPTECGITLEADPPVRVCAHLRRLAESVLDPIEQAVAHTGWLDSFLGRPGQPVTTWGKQINLARAALRRFEAQQRGRSGNA